MLCHNVSHDAFEGNYAQDIIADKILGIVIIGISSEHESLAFSLHHCRLL